VLELKEKLGDPALAPAAEARATHVVARDALVELGWSLARRRARARRRSTDELAPEERVRLALKRLHERATSS
jgi:hypothetical protein